MNNQREPSNTKLKIVFLTDLHLGHNRVPAKKVYQAYEELVVPYLDNANVLFFGGDTFDNLVTFDGETGQYCSTFINDIIARAAHTNLVVRILRGTYSHDRTQPWMFHFEKRLLKRWFSKEPNIKIIDEISVETISELNDLSVLYIPDGTYRDTLQSAINPVLDSAGYSKVDVVLHHGYVKHLLPPGISDHEKIPSKDDFKSICSGVVLNGHIHSPMTEGCVINGGSFDRLAHGEEEAKGFHTVEMNRKGTGWQVQSKFIENIYASLFKTINLSAFNDEDAVVELNDQLNKFPVGRFINLMVVTNSRNVRQSVRQIVTARDNDINLKFGSSKRNHVNTNEPIFKELNLVDVNPSNLPDIVHAELQNDTLSFEDVCSVLKCGERRLKENNNDD